MILLRHLTPLTETSLTEPVKLQGVVPQIMIQKKKEVPERPAGLKPESLTVQLIKSPKNSMHESVRTWF